MSSSEEIKNLLENSGMSLADLEFIIKYIEDSNLSPQLVMRRIKSYEKLQKKMKDSLDADKIKIDTLQSELEIKTRALEEANKKLEELGLAIQEEDEIRASLETKSELLDAELDELRTQLSLIQEMQFEDAGPPSPEAEEITAAITTIISELKIVMVEHEDMTPIVLPLINALSEAIASPNEMEFSSESINMAIEDFKFLTGDDEPVEPIAQKEVRKKSLVEPSTPSPMTKVSPVPGKTATPSDTQSKLDTPVHDKMQTRPMEERPTGAPRPLSKISDVPAEKKELTDITSSTTPVDKTSPVKSDTPTPIAAPVVKEEKPEIDTEEVVPTWAKVETQEEEKIEEPEITKESFVKPKGVTEKEPEAEEKEEEPPEEKKEEKQSTEFLSPSEILKRRQQAAAEREKREKEERERIEQLRLAAAKKAKEVEEKQEKGEETIVAPPEEELAVKASEPKLAEEEEPKPVAKPEPEEEEPQPVVETKPEPKEEQPKVDPKTAQVLSVFRDFIDEAKTTTNFNQRIRMICDQDEAYEIMGSIGLSQLYSYISRPVEMKKEVREMLNEWIKNGVPR